MSDGVGVDVDVYFVVHFLELEVIKSVGVKWTSNLDWFGGCAQVSPNLEPAFFAQAPIRVGNNRTVRCSSKVVKPSAEHNFIQAIVALTQELLTNCTID
jgi:hypothetical protein